jgi:3-oxoadipate enol-lactonase
VSNLLTNDSQIIKLSYFYVYLIELDIKRRYKMPKVKVGDINIYYEVHGKGEPLVMIPGMSANVDWLFMQIPAFSREYRVVAFDPRGAGRSDAPDIPYTMEMMADDLAGLLDAINIKSAHILGKSMGGRIAQQFALRFPERVRSLILACTRCGDTHGVRTTDPEIIDALRHPKVLPPEESARQTLRLMTSQKFIDKNPELIKQIIGKMMEHPAPPQGYLRQAQAGGASDTYERLPEIKVPTLVIHGEVDRTLPVENARILASRIPHVELVILKNMGHGFTFEAKDESNRIMLNFLRRHSTKKA